MNNINKKIRQKCLLEAQPSPIPDSIIHRLGFSFTEIWVDIKDYEGLYQVSNFGFIKSLGSSRNIAQNKIATRKQKILKINSSCDYNRVVLSKNGKIKTFFVHRLVAIAFIENSENKSEVNHINGIKRDNRSINLEWVTRKENHTHYLEILKNKKPTSMGALHWH